MRAVLAVLLVTLSGCGMLGWMNDGEGLILNPEDDYLDVEERPTLQIPEDLRTLEDTDPFPIPPVAEFINPRFFPDKPPLPDAIYANDNRDEVRIQRIGSRRWLVIPESPTTAWPKLKQFLSENGISLAYDNPANGRLNTEWLQIKAENYRDVVRTLLRDAKDGAQLNRGQDRMLIKVEQGLRDLTTEIHVRHENDSLTLPVRDDIDSLEVLNSDVAQVEADFLSEVGAYIAAKVSEQTVSKVAQQIGSTRKAELTRTLDGTPKLLLYLDYERAWATLGQALDNADVEIRALDQATGVLNITIPEEVLVGERDRTFLCRITFSCDNDDVQDVQLQIIAIENKVFEVVVAAESGQGEIDQDIAQQVLVMIREYST